MHKYRKGDTWLDNIKCEKDLWALPDQNKSQLCEELTKKGSSCY